MQKILYFLFSITLATLLIACGQQKHDPNTVRVGTISGPETTLMEVAKQVAKDQYGINIQIIEFTDYNMPNTALNDGSIDANVFQHALFLQAAIATHGYPLVIIGKTFIYPMGIYSRKITSLSELKDKAIVAIPNDPSNEARALRLLMKAELITLKNGNNTNATPQDVVNNPKQLVFKELDAAQLTRALPDVDIAVINTNYAVPAGLLPKKDALLIESNDSPYANVIVVQKKEQHKAIFKKFVNAVQSPEVAASAKTLFNDQAIPAWKVSKP